MKTRSASMRYDSQQVHGHIKSQLIDGKFHVYLDCGAGVVHGAIHEDEDAAIYICLGAAAGFDLDWESVKRSKGSER